jgi:hypothetical protein
MNPFVAHRNRLASEAAARDAIVARVNCHAQLSSMRSMPAIAPINLPGRKCDSGMTLDAQCEQARKVSEARAQLRTHWNESKLMARCGLRVERQHSGTEDGHLYCIVGTEDENGWYLWPEHARMDALAIAHDTLDAPMPLESAVRAPVLSREQRQYGKLMRDAIVRERVLTHEERERMQNEQNEQTHASKATKQAARAAELNGGVIPASKAKLSSVTRRPRLYGSLTDGLEVRAAARGAYGDRKVRIVPGLKVTQRDHYAPHSTLRHVYTIGVATHPDADGANYAQAIDHVRRHPSLAAVTVIYADGTRIVRPVSDYVSAEQAARAEARKARKATAVSQAREVMSASRAVHTSDERFGAHAELASGAA